MTEQEGWTRYVAVDPKKRSKKAISAPDIHFVLREIGLDPNAVDFGSINPRLGYVVYEHGLFVSPDEQSYFGIAGSLIAGPALFFGIGGDGETVDLLLSQLPEVIFYLGRRDVEAAIERGEVGRPAITINGAPIWEWPAPKPDFM